MRYRFAVIFGGVPVTKKWIEEIGADGYAESATGAVKLATLLMAAKKEKPDFAVAK